MPAGLFVMVLISITMGVGRVGQYACAKEDA